MATITSVTLEDPVVGLTAVLVNLSLAAGETITSVSRWTLSDQQLGIGNDGWTEGVPSTELPSTSTAYWDLNFSDGNNKWEFGIYDGTTTTYINTPTLTVDLDHVYIRTAYLNGGTLSGSRPSLGLDDAALMTYSRNGSTQNLVHKVPGRTGRPLVKYRTGQSITSNIKLLIAGDVNRSAENKLFDVEKVLGAAGELIIRRPNPIDGASVKLPDIRGAVQSYSVSHETVQTDTDQESVLWFVDVALVENRDHS